MIVAKFLMWSDTYYKKWNLFPGMIEVERVISDVKGLKMVYFVEF
jgi:hypothetical protein